MTLFKDKMTNEIQILLETIDELGYRVRSICSYHDSKSIGGQGSLNTLLCPCDRSGRVYHPASSTLPTDLVCYRTRDPADVCQEDHGQFQQKDASDHAFTKFPKRPVLTPNLRSRISQILKAETPAASRTLPPLPTSMIPDVNSQTASESAMEMTGVQYESLSSIDTLITQDLEGREAHGMMFAGHLPQPSSDALFSFPPPDASTQAFAAGSDQTQIFPSKSRLLPRPLESTSFTTTLGIDSQPREEAILGDVHDGLSPLPLDSGRVEELHHKDWFRTVTGSNRSNVAGSTTIAQRRISIPNLILPAQQLEQVPPERSAEESFPIHSEMNQS